MTHREAIKAYLGQIDLKGKSIVDWGCGTKPAIKYINAENCDYFGIDKLNHVGADLVTDISDHVSLKDNYDVAFCLEVLEHVGSPEDLMANIYRNLKVGGVFYFSVPFLYEVHSEEDYWRFTDQGLRLLLEYVGFTEIEIQETVNQRGWIGRAKA